MRLQIALILIASICSAQGRDINEPGGKLCEALSAQCVPSNMTCHSHNMIAEGICPRGNTCCDTSDTGGPDGHNIRNQTENDKDATLGTKKRCKPTKKCRKLNGACKAKCGSNEKTLKKGCKKKGCKCCIAKTRYCGSEALASQQRIVNGNDITKKRKYPWQVGIKKTKDWQYGCGGTFIKENVILTAAHCFKKKIDDICESVVPDEFWFGIGDYNYIKRPINISLPIQSILVKRCNVIYHKDYECNKLDDIALIKLDEKPNSDIPFHPICWPPADDQYVGPATVTGWGGLKGYDKPEPPGFVQTIPEVLQEAQVTIMYNSECKEQVPRITSNQMCTSNYLAMEDNTAPCQRDSGGPLFVTNSVGNHMIVGIVSYGRGCASQGNPTVYTRVSKFTNWIIKNIKSPSVCPSVG